MTENVYPPALGRLGPVRLYDRVVALTRERLWRALAAMYVAPGPGDAIVDVGCGTGTLALLLARVEPRAAITGRRRAHTRQRVSGMPSCRRARARRRWADSPTAAASTMVTSPRTAIATWKAAWRCRVLSPVGPRYTA
ncbi:hypothetical protein [Dactylosporangium salmoneum]|uniref:Methyltransferase domain-containing protein n=1 Tax=Dactylosporangium salmoneum TaxID=53361 RepID=A0ABN3I618_9ACTN